MTEWENQIIIPLKRNAEVREIEVFERIREINAKLEEKGYRHGMYSVKCQVIDDPRRLGFNRSDPIALCNAMTYGDIKWLPKVLKELDPEIISIATDRGIEIYSEEELEKTKHIYKGLYPKLFVGTEEVKRDIINFLKDTNQIVWSGEIMREFNYDRPNIDKAIFELIDEGIIKEFREEDKIYFDEESKESIREIIKDLVNKNPQKYENSRFIQLSDYTPTQLLEDIKKYRRFYKI